MRSKFVRCLLIILIIPAVVPAQQALVHSKIQRFYNFQPHLLTPQQMAQKSRALDLFWTQAEEQPELYVAALRQELADFSNPSFFLYDGSILLMNLSDDPADRKIALAAISRCDLRDPKSTDY